VVDAGGTGYLLLLDSLLTAVDGRPLPEAPAPDPNAPVVLTASERAEAGEGDDREWVEGSGTHLRYEVMYLLDAPDATVPAFKEVWAGIGDSIVVVGGDGLWNCHIHTNDVGAAIEAALDAGRPRNIRVTDLVEQMEEERWVRDATAAGPGAEEATGPTPKTAVVAVANGEGVGRIFRSLGVHHLVAGGQSMNPSTAQILDVVESVASTDVILLPNNDNIRPVAMQVCELATKTVRVVPTSGIVEGFAALLEYDPEAGADDNAAAMAGSARRVVAGEVTQAVRDATGPMGPIKAGDWLGISRDGVEVVDETLGDAACDLLGKLLRDDHELVTLIEGDGSATADTRHITEWLRENHSDVAVEVHHGGQPLYPYLISIE
jgi:DAK2 domain fusion protein YloV